MRFIFTFTIVVLSLAGITVAQDAKPLPPIKPIPRLLPPKGVEIGKEEREKLEARLATIIKDIAAAKLDESIKPDVEIYTKAVRWALDFDEFYDAKKDIAKAHAALDSAQKRLDELKLNKSSWTTQRGLLARGYRSDVDDSVQPYGLHIPANLDLSKPVPLLVWLHGRGDKETDLHFIATREKNKGEFAPDWCITLHPYGRGTIGFKFAGEIDVLDAIESVKKRYKIDEDRIALAGFSMGGAGAWHIGAHYADRFCVVHAGAGFVETAKYNRLKPEDYPQWYVQKLWGWYDVPAYTRNLFNVPVIAYSGEKDKQIQAAREMEAAFKAEGRELNHIIGPGFEHKYEPKAKEEILKQIKAAVDKGREKWPKKVHLQTRTLRYNRMHWVAIHAMDNQWEEARVDAGIDANGRPIVTTRNVRELSINLHGLKNGIAGTELVTIDGQQVEMRNFKGWGVLSLADGKTWTSGALGDELHKDGLTPGPIDDVFMSPFVVVEPKNLNLSSPKVERWVNFEFARFKRRWREVFRGDVRILEPGAIKEADTRRFNLVVWGGPTAFSLFSTGDQSDKAPKRWDGPDAIVTDPNIDWTSNVPILVYPRRLAPGKYVVFNSGPTFREGHDRTNSQQTPKLPDWAIIGLDRDPDAFAPGEIKAAGFFDENWKVKKDEKK